MKKFWIILVMLSFAFVLQAQKEIKEEDAMNNVGETVKICTKVLKALYDVNLEGKSTRLFSSNDTSHSPVTFIVPGDKRRNFDYKPEKDLKGREVCITGKVELLKGKPVVLVEKQTQVEIK